MREVTYNMDFRDRLQGYQTGLTHMTPLYKAIWGGIFLLIIAGPILAFWSKGYPATWPPSQLPSLPLLLNVGPPIGVGLVCYLFCSVIGWLLNRRRTVILQNHHLISKSRFGANAVSWKDVTDLLDTGRHICFCQNVPTAIVIPKLAFPNQEQADAFLEEARYYWRRETGQNDPPPMNTVGVWPPAPRVGNSAELDGKHSH